MTSIKIKSMDSESQTKIRNTFPWREHTHTHIFTNEYFHTHAKTHTCIYDVIYDLFMK